MKIGFFPCVSRYRRSIAAHLFALGAFVMLIPSPLNAQSLSIPINLAYLVKRADVIVQGQVVNIQQESLPGYANIRTINVTLKVEGMMRGPQGKTYTFRQILPAVRTKEGKMNYQVGQRLLLFLPDASKDGMSMPIGMEQGRFHIGHDAKGNETIANEIGNAGLFKDVAQDARKEGKALTGSQLRLASTGSGPVSLKEFSSLVQHLTSLKRIHALSK